MNKKYREANKEKIKVIKRKEYQRNKAKYIQKSRLHHYNLKKEVLNHYGHKCVFCGNTYYEHLTIDHILNDGAKHRKQMTKNLYSVVKEQGFPSKYQLLCWNCNCTKNRNFNSNNSKIRFKLIELLGNKCTCCGETKKEFLCIDHINGGGTKIYRKLGSYQVYKDLLSRGAPKNEVRVLCYNCNSAKGLHGYCPHKTLQEDKEKG